MTTPNRTTISPMTARFLESGHAARPQPTADLGDPVRADTTLPCRFAYGHSLWLHWQARGVATGHVCQR